MKRDNRKNAVCYLVGLAVGTIYGMVVGYALAKDIEERKKVKENEEHPVPEIRSYYNEEKDHPYTLIMEYVNQNTGDAVFKGGMEFVSADAMMRYLYTISYDAFNLCKNVA